MPVPARDEHWQVQEAKQRFSEVLRKAHDVGPQIVTKHGEEVAVVIDIAEYRRLREKKSDFKEFLMSAPDLSVLEIERSREPGRVIDFGDDYQ